MQRSECFVVTGGDVGTVCLPTSLLVALSPLLRDLQEFTDLTGHLLLPSAKEKELVELRLLSSVHPFVCVLSWSLKVHIFILFLTILVK